LVRYGNGDDFLAVVTDDRPPAHLAGSVRVAFVEGTVSPQWIPIQHIRPAPDAGEDKESKE
jgi:hypothetical protein